MYYEKKSLIIYNDIKIDLIWENKFKVKSKSIQYALVNVSTDNNGKWDIYLLKRWSSKFYNFSRKQSMQTF